MHEISSARLCQLAHFYQPEQPGPPITAHVANTGMGRAWVDDPVDPRVLIAQSGTSFSIHGDPAALTAEMLRPILKGGVVVAAPDFLPLITTTFPRLDTWHRIIGVSTDLPSDAPHIDTRPDATVLKLHAGHVADIANFDTSCAWIVESWNGPAGLAASGYSYGAWIDDELVSIAASFFVGDTYEDIAIVTAPAFRNRGLSTACVHALCCDIFARDHRASWGTSQDNLASWRVAQKVGFAHIRDDVLYAVERDTLT